MAKQVQTLLIQGMETQRSIEILLSFAGITSEKMIGALESHFIAGNNVQNSADLNGVSKSNLSRDIKKLNLVASKINEYFEINYNKSSR